jgi:hypothetical protein
MTDQTELEQQPSEAAKPDALGQFLIKVGAASFAALVVMFISVSFIASTFEGMVRDTPVLQGGAAFWSLVEYKLYKLADEPDLPPEKKAKIIKALTKLSVKYHPYVDALVSPAPKDKLAESQIR